MQEEMKVYYRFKIQMPMKVLIAEGTCAVVESKHADTEQNRRPMEASVLAMA